MRSLIDRWFIVDRKPDNGSYVVVLYYNDYVMKAEKLIDDTKIYENVSGSIGVILNLKEKSSNIFQNLKRINFLSEKQLKYLPFGFTKIRSLKKLYLLS